jgi:hypothetical protein
MHGTVYRRPVIRTVAETMDANRIVANGRANCLGASGNRKQVDGAIREIRARYDQEVRARGIGTRVRLWFEMRKEIRAAVERIAPSRGCYLRK